jgi:hypothetical protein
MLEQYSATGCYNIILLTILIEAFEEEYVLELFIPRTSCYDPQW